MRLVWSGGGDGAPRVEAQYEIQSPLAYTLACKVHGSLPRGVGRELICSVLQEHSGDFEAVVAGGAVHGRAWEMHGRCVGGAWEMRGRCMGGRGRCVGDAWEMRGMCVGDAWEMHGRCVGDAWEMHGRCVGDARGGEEGKPRGIGSSPAGFVQHQRGLLCPLAACLHL